MMKTVMIALVIMAGLFLAFFSNPQSFAEEAGLSGDDLSIQKTQIVDKIIQQDAQSDPDNLSSGNSVIPTTF
jgi:hypothetical protein